MRNRAILMLGLAVVFAVVAAFLAQSWLRSQVGDPVAPVIIHNRVDFAASMTNGLTVMEVDQETRSAGEVASLWKYIAQRLEKTHNIKRKSEDITVARPVGDDAKSPQPIGVTEADHSGTSTILRPPPLPTRAVEGKPAANRVPEAPIGANIS